MKRALFLATILAIFATTGAPSGPAQASSLQASNPSPSDGEQGVTTPLVEWTAGQTATFHDVYFGTNPTPGAAEYKGRQTWTVYFAAALAPRTTYYWRIDEIERDGKTMHSGEVWSFTTLGLTASNPNPSDGADSVATDVNLTWTAGSNAVRHEVYFGTDKASVAEGTGGTFKANQMARVYDPGILAEGTTYFWRIDEVEKNGDKHKGDVWSFSTVGPKEAVTYYVDGTNGSDNNDGLSLEKPFATIQKGIDSAKDGDTILVQVGIYSEQINFLGKAITVRSAGDAAVLEAPGDFAVCFYMGEGPQSVLKNFVVTNSFMGIFIVQSSPTIANVTVVKNRYGIEAYAGATPSISNSILWHNRSDDLFGCQARYSCIERGGEGQGNISADPMFVDAEKGDYHLRSQRGRYWPEHDVWVLDKVTSPCIDSGDPTADYSQEPKPNGARINMGAYGGTAYASLSETPALDCDTNRDGVVDMTDYALLAEKWLTCCWAAPNQPPFVIITAPANGAEFRGPVATIELEAHACDIDGTVVTVEFYADGDKIGADNNGSDGWGIVWSCSTMGAYEVTAKATDNRGGTTTSPAIEVIAALLGPRR